MGFYRADSELFTLIQELVFVLIQMWHLPLHEFILKTVVGIYMAGLAEWRMP
jgi:hypothetical protein